MRRIFMMMLLTVWVSGFVFQAWAQPVVEWKTLIDGTYMRFMHRTAGKVWPIASFQPLISFSPNALNSSRFSFKADVSAVFMPPQVMQNKLSMGDAAEVLEYSRPIPVLNEKGSIIASFQSEKITRKDKNKFIASGLFTINGHSEALDIPVNARIQKDVTGEMKLVMSGAFAFNPTVFLKEGMPDPELSEVPVSYQFSLIPNMQGGG